MQTDPIIVYRRSWCEDSDAAVEYFNEQKIAYKEIDIEIADNSSGIHAVSDIVSNHNVPVIFITAFPERLLTGEGAEPTFLVTKPFARASIKAAIGQALLLRDA